MANLRTQLNQLGDFEKKLILDKIIFEIELGTCDETAWLFDGEQERQFYMDLSKLIEGEIKKAQRLGEAVQQTGKALEALKA